MGNKSVGHGSRHSLPDIIFYDENTALAHCSSIYFIDHIGDFPPRCRGARCTGISTATPQPDGRILYFVVEGDNCSGVAFKHGISVAQLRQFNTRLDENCVLTIGQKLIVGLAILNGATAGAAPTLPSPTVTATPVSGTTEVCVLLFNDMNGDSLRQETEFGIDGGAVSLTISMVPTPILRTPPQPPTPIQLSRCVPVLWMCRPANMASPSRCRTNIMPRCY